jgi:hypothetical protein
LTPGDLLAFGAFVSRFAVKALANIKFVLAVVAAVSVSRHW